MRFALRLLVLVLLVFVVSAAGFYTLFAPIAAGDARRDRARRPKRAVELLRDRHGIPHIYAASLEDAHFALGFVHAQDRLWQMEMNRRIGSGRLAEILGANALEADRFMRTLGLRRGRSEPCALRRRDAPAAGRLRSGSERLPSSTPSPPARVLAARGDSGAVDPVDSVVWTKVMAWDLGANWRSELLRMQLSRASHDRAHPGVPAALSG